MSEQPPSVPDTDAEDSDELFEHFRFDVDPGQDLLRIDKFLMVRVPNVSRNKVQIAIRAGNVTVNKGNIKPNYKVRPGDVISVVFPYPERELELLPEDIPLDIVYEDEVLAVVNKPAGMVVHPGYGNYTGTLVNALLHHFDQLPQRKDYHGRPGIVHRLDKLTTGLMVIAKNETAMADLSGQFFHRTTSRTYQALVWGDLEEDSGTIEGNVGRSPKNRKVMHVFPHGEHGKHAVTHYKVLRRYGYVTLVECRLETGRTHQIRVHMKYLGHPLFNDPEYGGDKVLKGASFSSYKRFVENSFSCLPGQALHAKTLGFNHPETKERLEFDSELPEGFQELLDRWERYSTGRSV